MLEQINEHNQDARLARKQLSIVSEQNNATGHYPLWKEVTFTD